MYEGDGKLLREVGADPTLDDMMRRDPAAIDDDGLRHIVKLLRAERALFEIKEKARRDKSEGLLGIDWSKIGEDEDDDDASD